MRSLELLFDDATELALRDEWERVLAAGLPSLASHSGPTNRPHVTVAAGERLEVDEPIVAHAVAMLPIGVEFGGIVLFPAGRDRWVLARPLVMTASLAGLHRDAHLGLRAASELTLPDRWTPHSTISRRVAAEGIERVLSMLRRPPPHATLLEARIWDSSTKTVRGVGPSGVD